MSIELLNGKKIYCGEADVMLPKNCYSKMAYGEMTNECITTTYPYELRCVRAKREDIQSKRLPCCCAPSCDNFKPREDWNMDYKQKLRVMMLKELSTFIVELKDRNTGEFCGRPCVGCEAYTPSLHSQWQCLFNAVPEMVKDLKCDCCGQELPRVDWTMQTIEVPHITTRTCYVPMTEEDCQDTSCCKCLWNNSNHPFKNETELLCGVASGKGKTRAFCEWLANACPPLPLDPRGLPPHQVRAVRFRDRRRMAGLVSATHGIQSSDKLLKVISNGTIHGWTMPYVWWINKIWHRYKDRWTCR